MTGAGAETWRKFTFSTPRGWTNFDPTGLAPAAFRRGASGHLPLTLRSKRNIGLATWLPLGLITGTLLSWFVGAGLGAAQHSTNQFASVAWNVLFAIGVPSLLVGVLGLFVVKPIISPSGKVLRQEGGRPDQIVELRNVHPGFVAAVLQRQQAQEAQPGKALQPPPLSEPN